MGNQVNASPEESSKACFTFAKNISAKAKKNRKLLIDAMTKSGFVNYPTEWWHWSYGDRYWAYMANQPHAFYGTAK